MIELHVQYSPFSLEFEVRLINRLADGRVMIASAIEWQEVDVSAPSPEMTFSLHHEAADQFLDSLTHLGCQPRQAKDVAGIKAHLADMRKIVAAKLEVEL